MAAHVPGPPPERDHYTINSFKRTLCASLLIWVSRERPRSRSTSRFRVAAVSAASGVLVAVVAAARAGGHLPW